MAATGAAQTFPLNMTFSYRQKRRCGGWWFGTSKGRKAIHMQMEKQMFGKQIVGLHLQACVPCACPTSRQEKKPGVRDGHRDISGLMDEGSYICEVKPWSDTPPQW